MLFLLITMFLGCDKTSPLSGTITMNPQSDWLPMVYLIEPKNWNDVASSFVGNVIDSAKIDSDGHFTFSKMPSATEPRLFELVMQKKETPHYPNRLENDDPNLSNYCPLVYKNGESIVIKTDAAHFQRQFVIEKPSADNEAILKLRDIRQKAYDTFLASKQQETHDEAALLDAEKALLSFQQAIMQFATETTQLLPALTAIRWVSIEGNYERIPEFIVTQAERWKTTTPENLWVKQLNQKADRKILPVLIGDIIPNYSLPMLSGDTLTLQELLGKRLTILDLWASWCAPCRKENRLFLVPIWDKYHDKGFQIIGYALDASVQTWSNAIKKDGADRWHHASDLQGDNAALFKQLRLTSIPANFILDENGKVLAKNLHGELLTKFVDDFFRRQ
ncbi:MAG: TlpA family protein disulfide reductase [Saprospiraceae bacterium]|nr:TlpA family protein disulfide reductase [Saprospiraceae bacterium]